MDSNNVTFSISISNMTDVTAKDVHLWLRICDQCKYVNEPRESLHPEGSLKSERVWSNIELANDVQWEAHKVEIEIPPPYTQATVATKYRCPDCEIEKDWHYLTINLGRIGFPSFAPAPIPKTTKKRPNM
jgi:rubredoxin